ncbi:MAG: flagellar basal body P-ring protein FlgI [Phycisphaerales bacterium]|nr:flagellar basal body P-ring protein FlgI [Phycisphaerales bacterium]
MTQKSTQTTKRHPIAGCIAAGVLTLAVTAALATDVQTIVRVKGLENNQLTGMGLVVGLNGTGDSARRSDYPAKFLAEFYRNNGMGVSSPADLQGSDSVAVVSVSCLVPATGAREGDRLDATVSVLGNAKSLKGGTLTQSFVRFTKNGDVGAWVSGPIDVDPTNPRVGIIRQGLQMLSDIRADAFVEGSREVTLVLRPQYAGYPVANMLADQITQQLQIGTSGGEGRAVVRSPNEVVLTISDWAWERRTATLNYVLTMQIDTSLLELPARVVINRRAGVIALNGDVQISPVVISAKGLSITRINPPPVPSAADPIFNTEAQVKLSTVDDGLPTTQARLTDLFEALDALKVDFDTRVDVLYELKRLGALHAELIDAPQ